MLEPPPGLVSFHLLKVGAPVNSFFGRMSFGSTPFTVVSPEFFDFGLELLSLEDSGCVELVLEVISPVVPPENLGMVELIPVELWVVKFGCIVCALATAFLFPFWEEEVELLQAASASREIKSRAAIAALPAIELCRGN